MRPMAKESGTRAPRFDFSQGLPNLRAGQHVARFSKVPVTFRVRNKIFKPILKKENVHRSQQTSPFCFVK